MWSNWPNDCRFATPRARQSPAPQPARSPFELCSGSGQYYVSHERKWTWQSLDRTSSGQLEMAVVSLRGNVLSFLRVLAVIFGVVMSVHCMFWAKLFYSSVGSSECQVCSSVTWSASYLLRKRAGTFEIPFSACTCDFSVCSMFWSQWSEVLWCIQFFQ